MNTSKECYGYDDAYKAMDYVWGEIGDCDMDPHNVKDGLILGSGLGGFVNEHMEQSFCELPFAKIFEHLGIKQHSTNAPPGHAHKLIIGHLKDTSPDRLVIAQSGREHPYEGISMQRAVFWLRVMQLLGVETLLGSNAVGIITPKTLKIPSLMLVHSHIDTADDNPLVGSNDDSFGPRFPHMGDLYPQTSRALVKNVAKRLGFPLAEGTLCRTKGPNYESAETIYDLRAKLNALWEQGSKQPGEIRFASDPVGAVGMSSTFEHVVAQHASQSTGDPAFRRGRAHISVATNYGAGLSENGLGSFPNHTEVETNAKIVQDRFGKLIREVILELRKST